MESLRCITQLRAHEIANNLESMGWEYAGGHGTFCRDGCELWGYRFTNKDGGCALFDFTKNGAGLVSANVSGLPSEAI